MKALDVYTCLYHTDNPCLVLGNPKNQWKRELKKQVQNFMFCSRLHVILFVFYDAVLDGVADSGKYNDDNPRQWIVIHICQLCYAELIFVV